MISERNLWVNPKLPLSSHVDPFPKPNSAPSRPTTTTTRTSTQSQLTVDPQPQPEGEQGDGHPAFELSTTDKPKYPTPQRDAGVSDMGVASVRSPSGNTARRRIPVFAQNARRGQRCRKRPDRQALAGGRSTTETGCGDEAEAFRDGKMPYGL